MSVLLAGLTFNVKAQPKQIKHVILIGVDGFGAYAVPQANMPNLKQMMKTGAWSLKTRSVLPSSSAVNWASTIMGQAQPNMVIPNGEARCPKSHRQQRLNMVYFLPYLV